VLSELFVVFFDPPEPPEDKLSFADLEPHPAIAAASTRLNTSAKIFFNVLTLFLIFRSL
jgi:hypothetical protein